MRTIPTAVAVLLLPALLFAAEVKNDSARMEGSRLIITYDLEGPEAEADVSLTLTIEGKRYGQKDLHVEGDIGKVRPGKGKRVVWNGLRDFPKGFHGTVDWELTAGMNSPTGAVLVKGGCFQMGSLDKNPTDPPGGKRVCLNDYYMDACEVTRSEYARVTGRNPSSRECPNCPVDSVTWHDADRFCRTVGKRLPTEAEWEYAARSGGRQTAWSGTNDPSEAGRFAWYDRNSDTASHPVGTKRPNDLGLYDMTGNVAEWVGDVQAVRGGSWYNSVQDMAVTRSVPLSADTKNVVYGFRCAKSARGSLKVVTNMAGAQVTVNGELWGAGGVERGNLPPGRYDIDVTKEGFITWRKTVQLREGDVIREEADLEVDHGKRKAAAVAEISRSTVAIKGGCFRTGRAPRDSRETCVGPFHIGKYEITQGQWAVLMGDDPSLVRCEDGSCPVSNVTWTEAQEFIRRLNAESGQVYRLPTEAEWEFAAGGGAAQRAWAGTDNEQDLPAYAWYNFDSSYVAHPVGRKKPNALGLYDMSGNVWEWTADWYEEVPYASGPKDNPTGPETGPCRVVRGGSWYNNPESLRTTARACLRPDARASDVGLRVARTR